MERKENRKDRTENPIAGLPMLERAQLRAALEGVRWWTNEDACAYLNTSLRRLDEMVHAGKVSRVHGIGKERMFDRDEIMTLLENSLENVKDRHVS